MLKAISGALSLLLIILVLRLALPQVADVIISIIMKLLLIVNASIDQISITQHT